MVIFNLCSIIGQYGGEGNIAPVTRARSCLRVSTTPSCVISLDVTPWFHPSLQHLQPNLYNTITRSLEVVMCTFSHTAVSICHIKVCVSAFHIHTWKRQSRPHLFKIAYDASIQNRINSFVSFHFVFGSISNGLLTRLCNCHPHIQCSFALNALD